MYYKEHVTLNLRLMPPYDLHNQTRPSLRRLAIKKYIQYNDNYFSC